MARVADNAIRVQGMQEFLARMKELSVVTPTRVTRLALNEAAALVVTNARGRAPVQSGALRASIRASSTGKLARVTEGSAKVPYAGFIDYGGTVGRRRSTVEHQRARANRTASHGAVRPFRKDGRILYPAFQEERAAIIQQMDKSMHDAVNSVGLRTEA